MTCDFGEHVLSESGLAEGSKLNWNKSEMTHCVCSSELESHSQLELGHLDMPYMLVAAKSPTAVDLGWLTSILGCPQLRQT